VIPASVGVIANPSSGRDIRRLLAWASVFPTHEKVQTVLRLLAPMGRLGVAEAWMIPDRAGIAQRVCDEAADAVRRGLPMPAVRLIDMAVSDGPSDSAVAAGLLRARGAALIAVLGGDGTHRVVAAHCGAVPLATLSTGTNNAFPDRREATLVGMAAALVATGRVPAEISLRSNKVLRVRGASVDERALVDVAVSREPLLGARAVGDGGTLSELFASFAEPKVIGLSSIAGLLHPVARDEPYGVRVRFGPGRRLWAPILPGALEAVSVAGVERLHPGRPIRLPATPGTLALDGEREIEFDTGSGLSVELRLDGPRTLAVEATLAHAARHGLLVDGAVPNSC
jgi:predicted polyphosphate/ATP-dependent NAD kinase